MGLATSYYSASGSSYRDCYFLAQRFDEDAGYKPHDSECWVCGVEGGADNESVIANYYGRMGWLTGLWRSPSGRVFVSDGDGFIHTNADPRVEKNEWSETDLEVALFGIWGLDDDCVFCWGADTEVFHLYRFNGKSWSEVANPGFEIASMHGLGPKLIYAVGHEGGIARFDGKSWQRFPAPTGEQLISVFVADKDEVYAIGAGGWLFEGSSQGWGKVLRGPAARGSLQCVAKFKDELWVGGGQFGLFRRKGKTNQLECVKPNIHALSLDVRGELVIGADETIAGTPDGAKFKATGRGVVLDLLDGKELGYFLD